jgi:hypothetical protein
MGRQPKALRACLEVTSRRSLDMIRREEFPMFGSAPNPPDLPAAGGRGPWSDAIDNRVRQLRQAEIPYTLITDTLLQEFDVAVTPPQVGMRGIRLGLARPRRRLRCLCRSAVRETFQKALSRCSDGCKPVTNPEVAERFGNLWIARAHSASVLRKGNARSHRYANLASQSRRHCT